jgi:hypothetical protein
MTYFPKEESFLMPNMSLFYMAVALGSGLMIGIQSTFFTVIGRAIGPARASLVLNALGGVLAGINMIPAIGLQGRERWNIPRSAPVSATISVAMGMLITDTDHYAAGKGDALWAWKSFMRGHNPILMDFGLTEGVIPPDPSSENFETSQYNAFEQARYAMGDTLHYAQQVNLIEMEPNGELSSTGYALANPGAEYLVLQPDDSGGPFTVELVDGSYTGQWYSVNSRETTDVGEIKVPRGGSISFTAPFAKAGPAVLYLKRVEHR